MLTLVGNLEAALRGDTVRAREALRESFGEIRLKPDGEDLFLEFESTADRLALAVGDGKIGRVAGTCNLTRLHLTRRR